MPHSMMGEYNTNCIAYSQSYVEIAYQVLYKHVQLWCCCVTATFVDASEEHPTNNAKFLSLIDITVGQERILAHYDTQFNW